VTRRPSGGRRSPPPKPARDAGGRLAASRGVAFRRERASTDAAVKTLCEWSEKDIEKKLDKLAELVGAPRFVCASCARAAAKKGALCKPKRLPSADEEE